jgi:hypothetical protein
MTNRTIFTPKGKCQNCKENDCELEEIEIVGEKKQWCDACREGYNLEKNIKPEAKKYES